MIGKYGCVFWLVLLGTFSTHSNAEYLHPSLYNGTYALNCQNMGVNVFGKIRGPNGLSVDFAEDVPLICEDPELQKAAFEAAMNNILVQIVDTCAQSEILTNLIDCEVEAGKMINAIVGLNLLLVSIVPDQVEFKALFPNAFFWRLGIGPIITLSNWVDEDNNITQQTFRPFIFRNLTGNFLKLELPLTNLANVLPGCRALAGGSISGKLLLDNLYDNDPNTHDLLSKLSSDANVTCVRILADERYSASIGMKFRGNVEGERLF